MEMFGKPLTTDVDAMEAGLCVYIYIYMYVCIYIYIYIYIYRWAIETSHPLSIGPCLSRPLNRRAALHERSAEYGWKLH